MKEVTMAEREYLSETGVVITFHFDVQVLDVNLPNGVARRYMVDVLGDSLSGHDVLLHEFSDSVVFLEEHGSCVLKIDLLSGSIVEVGRMERTPLMEEGFDYCFFHVINGSILLCWELGVRCYDSNAGLIWEQIFDDMKVHPEITQTRILYDENQQKTELSLADGSLRVISTED